MITLVTPLALYRHKKYSHPKSWELCFIRYKFLGLLSLGDSISSDSERMAPRRWGEEPGYTELLQQRGGSLNVKRLLLIKGNQTSQVKEFSTFLCMGFPGGSAVKNLPANAGITGDTGLVPGLGRSLGGGNGDPLQYSCLKSCMDRRAWLAEVRWRGGGWSQRVGCNWATERERITFLQKNGNTGDIKRRNKTTVQSFLRQEV